MNNTAQPGMSLRTMTATNRLGVALVVIALAGASEPTRAQGALGSERGDTWSVWTSPARMRGRDALAAAATLGAAALTSRIDSAGYVWMQTHERTLVMR